MQTFAAVILSVCCGFSWSIDFDQEFYVMELRLNEELTTKMNIS